MQRPETLSPEKLKAELKKLPEWTLTDSGKIKRFYKFKNFNEAFSFMSRVAKIADKLDHHPEWSNVYNQVTVELITHDTAQKKPGLTELDFRLAQGMEEASCALEFQNG